MRRLLFGIKPVPLDGAVETLSGVNPQLMRAPGVGKEVYPAVLFVDHPIRGARRLSVLTDPITSGSHGVGAKGML